MQYNIKELANFIIHKTIVLQNDTTSVRCVALDSRNIAFANKALFFALKGRRLNAHSFIQEAYDKGVRNFIISENVDFQAFREANFIVVENVVKALQELAKYHRTQFSFPVIGITGSNGKTMVKEWLFQLLFDDFYIIKSPRSYNSQIGVPLSILEMKSQHDLAIFEAGISQVGEMQALTDIIQCNIGIFTNVGDAHNEGFLSLAEKVKEKMKLLQNCDISIICNDYIELDVYTPINGKTFTWSKKQNNAKLNVTINKILQFNKTTIIGKLQEKNVEITVPFTDDASIENAIHCWCVLLHLGYEQNIIQSRMMNLQPVALRLEIKSGINNCLIINDSYSLDLSSLVFALDFMGQQSQHGKRTLILSDIAQSGRLPEDLYTEVAALLNNHAIDKLIAIGTEISIIEKLVSLKTHFQYYKNVLDFLAKAKMSDFQSETILLKGARVFEFERIAELLELKAHRTVMEINLNALRHNLAAYTRRLSEGTKMLVMVKASAYGSGSAEVAKLMEYHKVDYLGVAYTDEAVELRKEGVKLPILVLNPEEASFHALLRYDIEPEVYCLSQLQRLLPYVQNAPQPLKIHIKLDTGMHRLGFETIDIQQLITILLSQKNIVVQSVFSHLAASDGASHDDFTKHQANSFLAMYEQITAALGYYPLRHICNTSGIARFPQYHFDMVRLGIGIYGVDSSNEMQAELEVVNTLKAMISQIKHIPKGESIGYSRRGVAERDLRIATISIGYADGFLRAAGNGRFSVSVRGELAPIIGNVCMDMCMIDITEIQEVQEGDEVVVFGDFPKVETLANITQTIAYEVFTNISERVKRVYFSE